MQTKVPQPRPIPPLTSCRGVDKRALWISQGHKKLGEHMEPPGLCNWAPVWRIPGTGEPGGLPSMGSHRVGHDWSDIAAAAAAATSCVTGDDASAVSLRKVALLGPRPQAEEATGILRKWNPQEQQNHIISLRLREQPRTNAPHREESPAMKTHAGCPTDTVNRAESQGFCRGGTFKDLLSQRPSHRIRGRRPREGRTCPRPQGE